MKEGGLMKKYTANVFVKDELKEITNREKDKPQRIIIWIAKNWKNNFNVANDF